MNVPFMWGSLRLAPIKRLTCSNVMVDIAANTWWLSVHHTHASRHCPKLDSTCMHACTHAQKLPPTWWVVAIS